MSERPRPCERFADLDPVDYLVDRDAETFAAWKAHFPDCDACSAALAELSALEWELGELGDAAHPDAVELDAYGLGHGLDSEARARIEAHLAGCPLCSDQLRALERFEQARAPARVEERASVPGAIAGWLERLGDKLRLVPAPVWVAAAVLVLFALYSARPDFGDAPEDSASRTAARVDVEKDETVTPAIEPPAPLVAPSAAPAPESLAERGDPVEPAPTTAEGSEPSQEPILAEAPARVEAPEAEPPPTREPARPEMLLAALDLPATLAYGGEGPGRGRLDLLGRGLAPSVGAPHPIQVLAPKDHRGRAGSPRIALVWSLASPRTEPVRVLIVDARAIDPIYEIAIEGPHASGLHAIDLAEHGVALEPGVEYVWSVALEVDAERPSRAPRSRAALERVDPQTEAAQRVARAPVGERIGAALENGLWYDAVSDLARAAAMRSDASAFAAALGELARAEEIGVAADPSITLHRP